MTLLLDAALDVTVVLLVAWGAAATLRSASADLRRCLWIAAIVAAAALPAELWIVQSLPATARILVAVPAAMHPAVIGSRHAGSGLTTAWAAGLVLVLLRLGAGLVAVARITRRARPVDGVRYSTEVATPMTWGVFRPHVVLPVAAQAWSPAQRDLVVAHERAHIARADWLWQIVAHVVCALFWFHPLVWVARAQLRRECERAADDSVLAAGADAASYARQLLDVARHARRALPAVVAMARPAGLEGRVRAILDSSRRRAPIHRGTLLALCLSVGALSVTLAAVQDGRVYRAGEDGVTLPRLIREVKPSYTDAALSAKIEGTVMLVSDIGIDGMPRNIRVTQSLEAGLDANAIAALEQWRFEPGRKDGEAVRVEVFIEITYTVK